MYSIISQIDKDRRNDLKIFFSGSKKNFNLLRDFCDKVEINFSTQVFKAESVFAVSIGAIYYCCLKISEGNKNIDNPYNYYNNVYQMIDNNVIFNTNVKSEKYNPKVIACIDFGTSGTDYCFAFNTPGKIELIYCGLPGQKEEIVNLLLR